MAQAKDAVTCPHCGTRNKSKWEFCVRCGESIREAVAAAAAETKAAKAATATRKAEAAAEARQDPGGSNVLAFVAVAALLTVGVAGLVYARREGPAPLPDPSAFTIPAKPTPAPPPPVTQGSPGAQAYAEAMKLGRAGDVQGAVPLFAQAAAEAPDNPIYQHAYGAALWKADQKDEALVAFSDAAALSPETYRLEYAKMLDLAGKSAEAGVEFQTILAAEPSQTDALVGLGLIYSRAKDYEKALPLLRQAAQAHPEDRDVVQALGVALDNKGDTAGAAAAYRTVLEQQPKAVDVRARYAEMLVKLGNLEVAEAVLRKGLNGAPDTAMLERQLGAVLEREGKKVEAARAYRAYARLQPDAPDAKAILSRADQLAPGADEGPEG
jgi:Flp pilus assembly protein TadD